MKKRCFSSYEEAIANETVDIELKGYAVFSVSVENDEKVFAVTPDGAMKALIKDDSALEDCE